jgi:hypothetical protein
VSSYIVLHPWDHVNYLVKKVMNSRVLCLKLVAPFLVMLAIHVNTCHKNVFQVLYDP